MSTQLVDLHACVVVLEYLVVGIALLGHSVGTVLTHAYAVSGAAGGEGDGVFGTASGLAAGVT